ncbi:MAG: PAS domain S-box protein [Chloroflexi bacterium]|nr:PAS domain S-box protein [Chloroflexota bacterium]
MKFSTWRYVGGVGLLAVIYYVSAKLGLQFATASGNVTLIWPPTGIALAALLLNGNRLWPGIALGSLLANASTGAPAGFVIGVALGNTLEALAGAALLRRVRFHNTLDRIQDVLYFIFFSAVVSTTLSATIGALSIGLTGMAPWAAFGSTWLVWWLGGALGALVMAPVLLTWGASPAPRWRPRQIIEAGALVTLLIVLSQIAFDSELFPVAFLQLAAYALFVFLIWVALRFGPRGTATVSFIVSGLAIFGTTHSHGAFAGETPQPNLIFLWAYVNAVSVVSMLLAAATRERKHAVDAQQLLIERLKSLEQTAPSPLEHDDLPEQVAPQIRLRATLLTVTVITVIIMFIFELITELVKPNLSPWQSYALTTLFTGFAVTFGAYLALRRQQTLYQQVIEEVSERRRVEEIRRRLAERTRQLEQTAQTLRALVAERQQAEEALQRERDFALTVMNNLGQGVTVTGPGGHFDYVNPAFAHMLGYAPEDLLGLTPQDITLPEDYPILFDAYTRRKAGETSSYEARLRRTDGNLIHALTTSAPRWQEGKVVGAIAVVTDLTDRKRTEDALRESEEQLRQFFDLAPTGKAVTTLDGRYIHANRAYCDLVGYSLEELKRRTFVEITHPDDVEADVSLFKRLAQNEIPLYQLEKRYIRKSGDIAHILIQATLLRDSGGQPKYIIGQAVDITERKLAEEEIRKLNEELERRVEERTAQLEAANKELEAFSYSVSHDLRAPLRAIDGFSRILLEDFAPQLSPEAQRYARLVTDNARRMGRLIDDLLAFSRLSRQPVQKQTVALNELAQQTIDDLRLDYQGRQVEFVVGDLPPAQGDPPLLKQVVVNLLSNAIKFTRQREAARIEIGSCREDGETVYFVKDNGVGFDMKYAHKLFGVFQRLHRAEDYEGTGVGLAIVQRIIQRHGGRVWAEAGLDEGATFYFTI